MGANIAGIYGAQIFREDDRPRYRRAFSVACAILAFGLILAIIRYIDDIVRRRRNATKAAESPESDSDYMSQIEKDGAIVPPSEDQPGPIVIGEDRKPSVSQGLKALS